MKRETITRKANDSLADDLIRGGEAIADFLGWEPWQVFYAARNGSLPIRKVGTQLVASKRALRRFFEAEG